MTEQTNETLPTDLFEIEETPKKKFHFSKKQIVIAAAATTAVASALYLKLKSHSNDEVAPENEMSEDEMLARLNNGTPASE